MRPAALAVPLTPGVLADGLMGVAAVLSDLGDPRRRLLLIRYMRSRPWKSRRMRTPSLSIVSMRSIFRLGLTGCLCCRRQPSSRKTVMGSEEPMELMTVTSETVSGSKICSLLPLKKRVYRFHMLRRRMGSDTLAATQRANMESRLTDSSPLSRIRGLQCSFRFSSCFALAKTREMSSG